jgi:hypothetical protein
MILPAQCFLCLRRPVAGMGNEVRAEGCQRLPIERSNVKSGWPLMIGHQLSGPRLSSRSGPRGAETAIEHGSPVHDGIVVVFPAVHMSIPPFGICRGSGSISIPAPVLDRDISRRTVSPPAVLSEPVYTSGQWSRTFPTQSMSRLHWPGSGTLGPLSSPFRRPATSTHPQAGYGVSQHALTILSYILFRPGRPVHLPNRSPWLRSTRYRVHTLDR